MADYPSVRKPKAFFKEGSYAKIAVKINVGVLSLSLADNGFYKLQGLDA